MFENVDTHIDPYLKTSCILKHRVRNYKACVKNKATAAHTTASVVYGWEGAVMQVKSSFGVFLHCVTDQPTD